MQFKKGACVVAQSVQAKQQGTIERRTSRCVGIGIEVVLDSIPKQEFVSKYLLRTVKNWLACDKALARNGQRGCDRGGR